MEITSLLQQVERGDQGAMNAMVPLIYNELKKLARSHLRREPDGIRLETTALVHEAFLKLSASRHPVYENRAHFYGIASRLMRQILVDAARARSSQKRNIAAEVSLTDIQDCAPEPDRSVLMMSAALDRLEETDPVLSRLIEMKYFGGMTAEESAETLELPVHVVRRHLRLAKAWLQREMAP